MKISDITAAIEEFAPLRTQEGFDNSGLLVGETGSEVHAALLCVDITEQVMDLAEALGADMVISHHPVIFTPLRRLTGATGAERIVARAIRRGIALYACHTNLDVAHGGLSWRLAEILGLENVRLLSPTCDECTGFGVTGTLPAPTPIAEFLGSVAEKLGVRALRHSLPVSQTVSRVAVSSGSGASLIDAAAASGADVFVAADFKYNHFVEVQGRITIADAGHFESEFCAVDVLFEIIRKKFPTFALHKCGEGSNPVHYLLNN